MLADLAFENRLTSGQIAISTKLTALKKTKPARPLHLVEACVLPSGLLNAALVRSSWQVSPVRVASANYTTALLEVVDRRLLFAAELVGRADMSRGGLMLRSVASGQGLTYIPVSRAQLRGPRLARLKPK
jgi:hypothetical protein